MKAIQLRKTTIDIPFMDGDKEILTLHFDRSDENVKRLYAAYDTIQQKVAALDTEEETDFDKLKEFLRETMDTILGEGSFEKLYQLSPSIQIVAVYFAQIAYGIKEELEQEDVKAIQNKYLG